MHNVRLIYRKEMSAFFNSPVAYVVLLVFVLITGWFFSQFFFLANQSDLRSLFEIIPWVLVCFVPAITMGLIAREKGSGTMEFLTTLPLTDGQIVLGKFCAAVMMIAMALVFTGVHFVTLLYIGKNVDVGATLAGYLGLLLLGAVYSAIGIFASAITGNQITAFLISFLIIAILFLLDKLLLFMPNFLVGTLQYLSVDYHLSNISRGVLDTRNLIYFGSLIAFFLVLSTRVLEMRRWK